jgi:hypothetical protein
VLRQGSASNYTTSESSNILIGNNGTATENNTIRIGGATGSSAGQQNRFFAYGVRGITTGNADAIAVLVDSAGQLGTVSSSKRYKENIQKIGLECANLMKLNPVKFNYKVHDSTQVNYGLIAEEVEKIMPRLVVKDQFGQCETVRYDQLIPLMLSELQRLNARIKILET